MLPILLSLSVFAAWTIAGVAVIALCGLDLRHPRVALTAPAVGSVVMVLILFTVSRAGVGLRIAGPWALGIGSIAAVLLIAWRRPKIAAIVVPVGVICVANAMLVGWPLFHFGFGWLGNANDDMANYVLSATKLLSRGLIAPLDVSGLAHDRDLASALQPLHTSGTRPGSDLGLAGISAVSRRPPYEVYMPTMVALNLSLISATGAMAAQATSRRAAPIVAVILAASAPLAAYAVFQQLIAQVWGLSIAAALVSLLFVEHLHGVRGPRFGDVFPIGLLLAGLILVYVEIATIFAAAYALFVAVLLLHSRLRIKSLARLWLVPILVVVVALNTYLPTELQFAARQASHGVRGSEGHLFGYALVPSALPAVVGLDILDPSTQTKFASWAILIAIIMLGLLALLAVVGTRRCDATAAVTAVLFVAAAYLAIRGADFGLFKLYMYAQPFAAATVAIALVRVPHRAVPFVATGLVLLLVSQFRAEQVYAARSERPLDLPQASSPALLPAVRQAVGASEVPVVSYTANPVLAKLEAAAAGDKALLLAGRNVMSDLLAANGVPLVLPPRLRKDISIVTRTDGWQSRVFELHESRPGAVDLFQANAHAERRVSSGDCRVALETGTEQPFNRNALPAGAKPVVIPRCGEPRDILAFVQSKLGQSYYLATKYRSISFFQLQQDYFIPGGTLSGFGRYALFRVINPTVGARLKLDVTTTLRHDGHNRLPPAATVGSARRALSLVGRGSARVYSAPLRSQMIGGVPYLVVDMGVNGTQLPVPRPGLTGLYGSSIPLDPRYLTSYVRDISLVSAAAYKALKAPRSLSRFPADLASSSTEYSGIYEDGWIGEDCYAILAGGRGTQLVVKADALPLRGQTLEVFVNGKLVAARRVAGGALEVSVPIGASTQKRRVELRFAKLGRLRAPDLRPATARLLFFGLAGRG